MSKTKSKTREDETVYRLTVKGLLDMHLPAELVTRVSDAIELYLRRLQKTAGSKTTVAAIVAPPDKGGLEIVELETDTPKK